VKQAGRLQKAHPVKAQIIDQHENDVARMLGGCSGRRGPLGVKAAA
jgi:hypothetical protein